MHLFKAVVKIKRVHRGGALFFKVVITSPIKNYHEYSLPR
jgi:hypothetical protein